MSRTTALVVLFLAAVLEAGGDALVRYGLQASTTATRLALFALGCVWLVFNQRPTGSVVLGGAFIVAGGVIMAVR